ncbi:MAG: hypothetical protein EBX37_19405, partial [Alphaproteobacteria bacterium]|nr:hypothetical protein [Alphaproteobacteria bacterium]
RVGFAAIFCFLSISGCQQPADTEKLASGQVVSLGKEHLIVQDGGHVMFLSVDETTKRNLAKLKKGENITLIGKKEVVEVSPGHTRQSSEVYSIEKSDGTRIALR